MKETRVSPTDLWRHWKANARLKSGEIIRYVSARNLPSWNDICDGFEWNTFSLSDGHLKAKNHGFCGVYRIVALHTDSSGQSPRTIPRAFGQDSTGTIYIGETKSLSHRFNQLRSSLRRRAGSHSAARTLEYFPETFFPVKQLAVSMLFTGTNTKYIESDLIRSYMYTFGDTPPLNIRFNRF